MGDLKSKKTLFTKDGFLITNDLGFFDEKGYLFVLGRESDIVKFDDGNFYDRGKIALRFREHLRVLDQVVATQVQVGDESLNYVFEYYIKFTFRLDGIAS